MDMELLEIQPGTRKEGWISFGVGDIVKLPFIGIRGDKGVVL